ncbi:hypothetical protein [Streptomyces sp. NPDC050759]|uniref:hypothetical protein n=1 Tax=Streptomyces sp. NPDC050759 TaxID=3365635 RepID=UPI0037B2EBFA
MNTMMACKNCGAEMYKTGICARCDWHVGWMPVAQHSDGSTTFVTERRHTFMAGSLILATVIGIIAVVASATSGSAAGAAVGSLLTAAAMVAWKKTRLGKVWTGLPPDDRLAAWPGVFVSVALAIVCIPITLMCIAFINMARLDR